MKNLVPDLKPCIDSSRRYLTAGFSRGRGSPAGRTTRCLSTSATRTTAPPRALGPPAAPLRTSPWSSSACTAQTAASPSSSRSCTIPSVSAQSCTRLRAPPAATAFPQAQVQTDEEKFGCAPAINHFLEEHFFFRSSPWSCINQAPVFQVLNGVSTPPSNVAITAGQGESPPAVKDCYFGLCSH